MSRFNTFTKEEAIAAGFEEAEEWMDSERMFMLETLPDGKVRHLGTDGGEPEDNRFYRDWSWVETELNKAYEQGLKDGKEAK